MKRLRFGLMTVVVAATVGGAVSVAPAASATYMVQPVDNGMMTLNTWAGSGQLNLGYTYSGATSLDYLGVNIGLKGDTPAWRVNMEMWHENVAPSAGAHPTTAVGDYRFAWSEAAPGSGNDPTTGPTDIVGPGELPPGVGVSILSQSGIGETDQLSTTWQIPLALIEQSHKPSKVVNGILIGGTFEGPAGDGEYPDEFTAGDQETYESVTVVPSPAAAGAGLALLGGLLLKRRRGDRAA